MQRLVAYAEELEIIGRFSEAETLYVEAEKIQPTKTAAYNLGRLYFIQRQYGKSIEELLKVKNLDKGKHPEINLYIGLVYHRLDNQLESNQYISDYIGSNKYEYLF